MKKKNSVQSIFYKTVRREKVYVCIVLFFLLFFPREIVVFIFSFFFWFLFCYCCGQAAFFSWFVYYYIRYWNRNKEYFFVVPKSNFFVFVFLFLEKLLGMTNKMKKFSLCTKNG